MSSIKASYTSFSSALLNFTADFPVTVVADLKKIQSARFLRHHSISKVTEPQMSFKNALKALCLYSYKGMSILGMLQERKSESLP